MRDVFFGRERAERAFFRNGRAGFFGALDDEDVFAAGFGRFVKSRGARDRRADDLFVALGQLAAEGDPPLAAEGGLKVGQYRLP